MQVCQDFLNGRCHRSNCRYQHQARPDGTMPEQIAVPAVPKFVAPPGLDETLYDPMTGFGLFGKPTYGTRYGSGPLPIIRAEDTRPICIEFFNSGRCTRRGPHGQSCMYRHVSKDDPNKVDQNAPSKPEKSKQPSRPKLPHNWVSESSQKHPLLPSTKKVDTEQLAAAARAWIEARAKRAEEAAAAAEAAAQEAAEAGERAARAAEAAAAAPAADADGPTAGEVGAPAAAAAAGTDGAGLLTTASVGAAVDEAAREEYLRKLAAWNAHNQAYQQQQMQQQQQQQAGAPPAGYGPPAGMPYAAMPPPGAMRLPVAPPPHGRPGPY